MYGDASIMRFYSAFRSASACFNAESGFKQRLSCLSLCHDLTSQRFEVTNTILQLTDKLKPDSCNLMIDVVDICLSHCMVCIEVESGFYIATPLLHVVG